ncbi:hypothetical protein SAMN03159343_1962 [Klenkia marina]|uniref:Uncharacterized protein n=1 Tax=Klenkia marina TaxID=1960309 RepID=A0A1G4Y1F6_9ACTN|nr:hypothetical protein [Klenkia marina]SCX47213.1 hypothetical protein SAMN03159343_1962 [Klenkia marina]
MAPRRTDQQRRPSSPARGATASARRGAPSRRTAPAVPVDRLVVGPVPVVARAAGALLALAGLVGAVAVFPAYLVVDDVRLSLATGPLDVLVALVAPVVALAVGGLTVAGRVPRFGLAYAAVTGGLAVGRVLIELHQGTASTTRPGIEVLAGDLVVTSTVRTAPGWVLGLAALVLSVLAGLLALVAWGRTVMEDAGSLDPLRPVLAGSAVLLGALAALCLALPAADVRDELVTDPRTGLVSVVTAEGPRALLERPGAALLGGLLLAGALLLSGVVAASLRPRLAAVGGLLAVGVAVLAAGLAGLRDALHSPDLDWTLPGVGLLLAGLALSGLAGLAWRWRPAPGRTPGRALGLGDPDDLLDEAADAFPEGRRGGR